MLRVEAMSDLRIVLGSCELVVALLLLKIVTGGSGCCISLFVSSSRKERVRPNTELSYCLRRSDSGRDDCRPFQDGKSSSAEKESATFTS